MLRKTTKELLEVQLKISSIIIEDNMNNDEEKVANIVKINKKMSQNTHT